MKDLPFTSATIILGTVAIAVWVLPKLAYV